MILSRGFEDTRSRVDPRARIAKGVEDGKVGEAGRAEEPIEGSRNDAANTGIGEAY